MFNYTLLITLHVNQVMFLFNNKDIYTHFTGEKRIFLSVKQNVLLLIIPSTDMYEKAGRESTS